MPIYFVFFLPIDYRWFGSLCSIRKSTLNLFMQSIRFWKRKGDTVKDCLVWLEEAWRRKYRIENRIREILLKKKREAKSMKDWILEEKEERERKKGQQRWRKNFGRNLYGYVKGNMRVYICYSVCCRRKRKLKRGRRV